VSYFVTLQELPAIKPEYIPIVRDIIEAAKKKVALSQSEGFEEELFRFTVEDDGDIHSDEWYDIGQEDEAWIS
jgi:hypothetical protein